MNCIACKKEIPQASLFCLHCGKKQTVTARKSSRRSDGEGTIHKRVDRKSKLWMALAPLKHGKREVVGYYETSAQARIALDKYKSNPTTKLNITLNELYEEWKILGYKGKSKGTIGGYNAAWKNLSPIHLLKFREIRTADIQKIVEARQTTQKHGDITVQALGFSALSDLKTLMHLLYTYAEQNDIVNKSYANFIVLPERNREVKSVFTDFELKKIEKSVGKVQYANYILALCYTGFRSGEFLSLTKFNVKEIDGVTLLVGGSKTTAGRNRTVPVHEKIKPIIEQQLLIAGDSLFCRLSDNTKMSPDYFRKFIFLPVLKKIGVSALTPHAARRTFATRLQAAGARPEDIQKILGHSNYQVSVDSYINQSAETLHQAIAKLR